MNLKKFSIFFLFIVLLIIVSCSDSDSSSSERALLKEADIILEDIAKLMGVKITHKVKKGFKSKSEVEKFLKKMMEEEYPADKFINDEKMLKFLGLIPKNFDLKTKITALYMEQLGGFYDPGNKSLYLIRFGEMPMMDNPVIRKILMAHELCHALQDMYADLDALTNIKKNKNNDRLAAVTAAIEGQATIMMMQYVLNIDPLQIPNFSGMKSEILSSGENTMGVSFKEFRDAPLYIKEGLLMFPYINGTIFYQEYLRNKSIYFKTEEITWR